ncbi:unnamed protein product [Heterosigma akashiwo]
MPDWDMWHDAAVKEYQSLVDNNVFVLVERPSDKENVIKSRWVLAKKFEEDGVVLTKYKGRLVAKGYSQQPERWLHFYMRKVGDAVTYVTIYVDVTVMAFNGDRTVAALKAILKKKYRITDAGRLESFLGLKINRNLGKKTIHISQSQFIRDALVKFSFDHYYPPAKTPMDPTIDLSVNSEYQASGDDVNRFRSMVGTLSWIAT